MDEQDHDTFAKDSSTPATESLVEWEESIRKHLDELDRVGRLISAAWTSPLTAVEAVREQRRELISSEWVMEKRVGVRQFKNEATRIVREVREERAEYVITVDGEPAAKLVPIEPSRESIEERDQEIRRHLREVDEIAARITAAWKSPLSAVEAVKEQRRDL
ncbi:MAG: type II toxin-antitoxin system prevent-host-death family antitoxin [Dehalococcoidia bacterium]